jgi:hypothetical protein
MERSFLYFEFHFLFVAIFSLGILWIVLPTWLDYKIDF